MTFPAPSARLRRARLLLLVLLLGVVASACSSAPAATFSVTGPCLADGRVPGAYPNLEALIPKTLDGRTPDHLDSGRNCSAANLGSLAGHGVVQLEFAGGVWADSGTQGISLAVFTAPGLQAAWLGEWYEASARAAKDTQNFVPTRLQIGGRDAYRLDLLNGEVQQAVIVWPSTSPDTVNALIASGTTEQRITDGIATFH